ncbi:MAG: SH3 domain-containing protein [Halobacteriovoraceae bacterium]|nr:SH3 domain-containing protein [Halobacteriovoraceae bacterium]
MRDLKSNSYNRSVNNSTDLSKSLESLYLKKDYIAVQKKLLENKDSFDLGVFHYNLGTILGKQKNFPAARYNLEKASHLGFLDSRLKNNLQTIKGQLASKDIDTSDHWQDQFLNFGLGIPESFFFTWTLICILTVLLLKHFKKLQKMIPILICLFFAIFPLFISQFYFNKIKYAINLKATPLREGPSSIYSEIMTIEAGSKFIVGESNNGWIYVRYPYFLSGWVKKEFLAMY